MTTGLLVRVAAVLLPRGLYERFLSEWMAEVHAVRESDGAGAAFAFAGSLLPAAVRTTLEVRSENETAYAELAIAALCALPPVLFLLGFGLFESAWSIVFAQTPSLIGILLVAYGMWRNEGRLLDTVAPRIGLVCVIVGAIGGIILVENNPALAAVRPVEVIPSEIPNALIPIGFFLLVAAQYTGQWRRRLQLGALWILAPGAAAAVLVGIINAVNSPGISSAFLSLLYGVPILGLAWAAYVIAGRAKVFAEGEEGEDTALAA